MRHHALGLNIMFARGAEVGVAQEIVGDGDLVGAVSTSLVTAMSRNSCGQMALPKACLVRVSICCRIDTLPMDRPERLSQKSPSTPRRLLVFPINWSAGRRT